MTEEKVSLANLAQGACVVQFDKALETALENIADEATKVKQARTITLKVSIVPTEDRALGVVSISTNVTLAGMEPVDHTVTFSQEGKRQVAYQRPLFSEQPSQPRFVKP